MDTGTATGPPPPVVRSRRSVVDTSKRTERKKPYTPPRLTFFGSLRDLTRTKGGTTNDGGAKPTTRITAKPT
jgi:hypothetical protein